MSFTNTNNPEGVQYLYPGENATRSSLDSDTYHYVLYHGEHTVSVEAGDCLLYISGTWAHLVRGPVTIQSDTFAVKIRGYAPSDRSSSLQGRMVLPYINGCSIRQVFPPERPGDPTAQILVVPANSAEQAHHTHSTSRVVHVLEGTGTCVVGIGEHVHKTQLRAGMSLVLDNMCPHHFETQNEPLKVLPVHIWSALPGGAEYDHPMFNGTFLIDAKK